VRALLRMCRALLRLCRALLSMCRALFEKAQHTYAQVGLSAGEAAGVVLGKCRRFYCVYGDTGLRCSVFSIYIRLFGKFLCTHVCVAGQISSVFLPSLRYRFLLECKPYIGGEHTIKKTCKRAIYRRGTCICDTGFCSSVFLIYIGLFCIFPCTHRRGAGTIS